MRIGILGLPLLGGGNILRTEICECDLTGVRIKEYSAPTAPRDQQIVLSLQTMAHVFAAPDLNRRADSIGKSAAVGFSRILKEGN